MGLHAKQHPQKVNFARLKTGMWIAPRTWGGGGLFGAANARRPILGTSGPNFGVSMAGNHKSGGFQVKWHPRIANLARLKPDIWAAPRSWGGGVRLAQKTRGAQFRALPGPISGFQWRVTIKSGGLQVKWHPRKVNLEPFNPKKQPAPQTGLRRGSHTVGVIAPQNRI